MNEIHISESTPPILSAHNISKAYGALQALENISLEVRENEIFGVIGADGAGKSTLFRILTTLLLPDSGECCIDGLDIYKDYAKIRQILGYMPGNFSLYMDLSIEENLEFFATLFGVSIQENFSLIEPIYKALAPFKQRAAKDLSGGMKQKLALCCALIHKPKILFLDEPTTGVDTVSRKEFWDILENLKSQMTIIASTPYMDEASRCDRIALLHQGKILALDNPDSLCASFPRPLYEFKSIPTHILPILRKKEWVQSCFLFGNSCHITFKDTAHITDCIKEIESLVRESSPATDSTHTKDSVQILDSKEALESKAFAAQGLQNGTSFHHYLDFSEESKDAKSPHTESTKILKSTSPNHPRKSQTLEYRRIAPSIEDCFMEFLL